jgi:hypothetical protein
MGCDDELSVGRTEGPEDEGRVYDSLTLREHENTLMAKSTAEAASRAGHHGSSDATHLQWRRVPPLPSAT